MLVLHSYFRSSASYRVRIALELKALTYEYVPVHLVRGGGEQHSERFSAMNPAQLVPVLIHDGVVMTQSMAIIEYLDEIFPQAPLLPSGAQARVRVRSMAQAIACEIHPLNNLRVLQQLEAMFGATAEIKNRWYTQWVTSGFTAIESLLAAEPSTFCVGESPTLADCCLIPQVYNAQRFDIALDAFPNIVRVTETCNAIDAFRRAAPTAQPDAA